ncbi:MAG: SRPBCC family protein [Candidatus Limnocylindria bacterium]
MTTIRKQIVTALPMDEAFAYIADFANSAEWDPGVETAERMNDGAVGVGARYRLTVVMGGRTAPMEYEITRHEPSDRVVLDGSGSGVTAVDDIGFAATPDGTVIDYTATIQLGGLLRLVQPFMGKTFAGIGERAADGMKRTLDERALQRRDGR